MSQIEKTADALAAGYELVNENVLLQLENYRISLRSNSIELLKKLENYFSHTLANSQANLPADIEIVAIEREEPELDLTFIDWKREPGKTGRKDSYLDLQGSRLVRKVRTGMIFLQSKHHLIAAGPCLANDNQLINYINSQYMNYLQQQGALICHAAAATFKGECLAIAGFSGGGKSTLMLNLLEHPDAGYLTNDRLFLERSGESLSAKGIPKLPRINPGTIMNNDRLCSILPEVRRVELSALSKEELWDLEEKYDVFPEQVYGPGKIVSKARLRAVLILNWQRNSVDVCEINQVDINVRRDLLPAVMKSPGPFYQYPDGSFYRDDTPLDDQSYIALLGEVEVFEVIGKVDFEFARRYCLEHIIQ